MERTGWMSYREEQDETVTPVLTTDAAAGQSAPSASAEAPVEILERMTDAFCALDASMRFTYLNTAAERLLSCRREAVLGHTIGEVFPEAVGSPFQQQYEQARASGEMVSFVSFYPPLGRWLSVRAYPDANGGLTIYFQDVTDQHTRERRMRLLFDTLPQGVVFHDVSGRITTANLAALEILGLSLDELVTRTSLDPQWHAIHEDGTPWSGETHPAMEALRTGQPVTGAVMGVFHPREGAYRWVRISALPFTDQGEEAEAEHPTEALTIFEDITERIAAVREQERLSRELWEQTEELRRVMETAGVGLTRCSRDLRYLSANPAYAAIVGVPVDEIAGKSLSEVVGEGGFSTKRPYIERVLRGERVEYEADVPFAEGGVRSVHVVYTPDEDSDGAIVGWVASMTDITQRKQMEERLRESEQRFRSTFENAAVGIAHVAPDGHWLRVNDRYCAILGYTHEELQERAYQEVTHPDDLEATLENMRQMLAGKRDRFQMEKRYIRKGGASVWVQVTVALVRDEAGTPQYFIKAVADISARKRAEEALRESEEKFRTLADNMSQFAWMADKDGEIFWYNQRWYEYTGTTFEESRGWGWRRVHHPDHVERVVTRVQHAWDTGEPWEDTFPIRSKDGRYRWFLSRALPVRDASGAVVRWFGTNTDIEDQRQLQEELAAANDALSKAVERAEERAGQLAAILDAMGDGVALIGPTGEIARTNPTFDRLLDLEDSADEQTVDAQASVAERRALLSLTDATGQPLPDEAWPTTRLLRGETFTGSQAPDLRLTGALGREVVVNVSGVPLRDERGRPSGGVLVLRDMTERYNREQERAQILHVVAHELRTPLTSLKATVQINQRRVAQGVSLTAEHLEPEARAVARMERLVNDLVEAARTETVQLDLQWTPTDLTMLCEQVASEQMAASGRGILLDLPAAPVVAEVDGGRIAQVVGNLLSNALKYTPPEATVTLQLRSEDAAAVITVRDTGPGIRKDALPHLFERFYRVPGAQMLHGSGAGLGVGLYLCKQFIERHHGTISVTSRLGHGTTFTVRMPLAQPADEQEDNSSGRFMVDGG